MAGRGNNPHYNTGLEMTMQNLSCADFEIPLCFVGSISWQKRARTIQHYGGYVTSRGFETAEISARINIDFSLCKLFGIDPQSIFAKIEATTTSRTAQSGVFRLGGFAIYPELEFALTNVNKTLTPDPGLIECDCVWSGVKTVKNVARENALETRPFNSLPNIVLTVGSASLSIQDFAGINEFVTTPDSVSIVLSIGSDMDLVNREGFQQDLLNGGVVDVSLPQGNTRYYVIQADLTDEQLSIVGSVYKPQSQRSITRTYQDASIKAIVDDLAASAGIECRCIADGKVDYYRVFGAPLDAIRSLQQSAGFIMSYRGGVLTCVDVPDSISSENEIEFIEMQADTDSEPINGCYWYDGINQKTAGTLDKTALRIYSSFRSDADYSQKCLNFARYQKNNIVIRSEIMQNIDTHSVVSVRSNDMIIPCMVEWFEFDWLNNQMSLELHYVGG